ncbi:MAG: hypothetical protein MMC33_001286 [Icmadophila ericetorum]|nr:hypothetical protein [Icmadophila ericetorum]
MHLLVIGGSGRTGKLVAEEALKRGHSLTALIRNSGSLQSRDGLTIIEGSPLNKPDVEAAFNAEPVNAVIVTLNAPRKSDNPFSAPVSPPRLMADSHANIAAVMKQHGVTKIVTMAAFGVGDSFSNANVLIRLIFKYSNMSYQFEDHGLVDQEMKASGLNYVLVRPTMLAEGEAQPIKEFGNTGRGVGVTSKITRKSVAVFLVDAAEKNKWDKTTPVLTN